MMREIRSKNAAAFTGVLALMLVATAPSGLAYSSKEAKEKVEAAEKALQNAQRADDRTKKAADDWTEKASQSIQDSQEAQKKRKEADAAREKADQTGEEKDVKAAEKAEKVARAAEKKAGESEKAFEAALQAYEEARAERDAARDQVPPLIEPAEKAVEELPQSSVKDKLRERIKKLKDASQQWAFVFPTKLDSEKVGLSIAGTKETIGHVATLTLTNHSNENFFIRILPTILASKTGRVQNYALPETVETALAPRETKAIPLTGVCLDARVPPAGPEDKDELMLLDPETLDANWRKQLEGTQAVIQTTQELQHKGRYKTPYSKHPEKERDTIVQWTTWLFVSTLKGNPVTKEDLKKKVYEQVGELTPEKREKLDPGVDDLWTAIKLTGAEAKVLSEETEKVSAAPDEDELEALREKEKELEEEYKKAMEEFEKTRKALEEANKQGGAEPEIEVQGGVIVSPHGKTKRKKFEPRTELEKAFLDAMEALKQKEAELQKAALEREAAEKERKKTQVQKPLLPQPPVVNPPPVAGVIQVEEPQNPPQGPCGFFEKELLRTVETEWRPKGGRGFAIPGRDEAIIVVWEKDIENEFQVTGHCPLPVGHGGDHVPVEKVYEKVKTVTQEESYPPGTRRPNPPKGLGLPLKK